MTWGFSQSFFVTLSTYFKVFEVTVVKLATGKASLDSNGYRHFTLLDSRRVFLRAAAGELEASLVQKSKVTWYNHSARSTNLAIP